MKTHTAPPQSSGTMIGHRRFCVLIHLTVALAAISVANLVDANPVSDGYVSDLEITATVSDSTAQTGDAVTFNLTVTNHGPHDASNVRVESPLPSGYAFLSALSATGSYDPATGIWSVGTLVDQAAVTLRIEAAVLAEGGNLHMVSVESDNHDPDSGNNHAMAAVGGPDGPMTADPVHFIPQASTVDITTDAEEENPKLPIVNGLFYGDGDHQRYVLLTTSENGSRLYGYFDTNTGRYYAALVVNRHVNDNVFGNRQYTTDAGWSPPRPFTRLTDSEYMKFTLTCGEHSWTWKQAYCAQPGGGADLSSPNWQSSHLVGAGSGTPPPGYVSASSLAWNLNHHAAGNASSWDVSQGGTLSRNNWKSPFDPASPDTVIGLDGYPASGEIHFSETHGWEWAMVYEFSVDLSGIGPHPVRLSQIGSHHSPAKSGGEDDPIVISGPLLDWGDLPAPYPTLHSQNGPRHEVVMSGAFLGNLPPDMEMDGQPHPAALGDDLNGISDEDGVRFLTPVTAGSAAQIEVTAGTAGYLSAWMDFNGDGTLTQLNPVSVTGPAPVAAGLIGDLHLPQPGVYVFTIMAPSDATGLMPSRWRFTNEAGQGGNSITGLAQTGEVEDYMLSAIGDRVWLDSNFNGLQDAGEPGVADLTVRLLDAHGSPVRDGKGNALVATTDSDGKYLFTGLPAGTYQVEFIRPDGHLFTLADADGSGLNGPLNSDANPVTGRSALFQLGSGEINTHIDAGLYIPGSISGGVYFDSTGDDFGDTPMQGVVLSLVDADGNPVRDAHDVTLSTTTGEDGKYCFTNLPPGFYQVVQTQPAGYISVSDVDGGDLDINGDVSIIALGMGHHITGQDFVETKLTTISGHVFVKTTPLEGVTITLIDRYGNPVDGDPATPGIQPITTVTGANGYYVFHNVPAGTYMVGQTRPQGYLSFGDADGGDPDLIGDVTPIRTLPGEHSENNDFILMLDGCPDDWDEWKLQHPGETPAGNPDADAYDNFAEFAFAMPYDQGSGSEWLGHTAWIIRPSGIAPGTLEGVFIRPKGAYLNVTYTLLYAATLGNPTEWQELVIDTGLAANATTEDNGDCTETVTIHDLENLTGMTGGEGFVRIRADLDDDGGNNGDIDHTSFTEVQGWTATDLDPHCQSYNNPYLTESVFTGTISGVSGYDAVLGIGSGPLDFATLLDPAYSYFIEVQSGDLEGHRFDIVAGAGNALTLGDGPGTTLFLGSGESPVDGPSSIVIGGLPVELVGGRIAVHRHRTLDNLFPPTGFGAATSRANADKVRVFAGGQWSDYWLYSNSGSPVWLKAGTNSLDDHGITVIPPGQGVFFDSPQTTTSLLAYGEVRENQFVRPLETGHSLVGGGFPINQSANGLNGRNMNSGTGFLATNDFKTADSFFYWNGDFNPGARGYTTYYMLDGSSVNVGFRWVRVGDARLNMRDNEILLHSDRAVFIRSKDGLGNHSMPAPWTP